MMKLTKVIALLLLMALLFSLGACKPKDEEQSSSSEEASEEEYPEYPVTVGDAVLTARPGKIVSLSPSITEKLCDLGFEDRLAGISDYCDYPEEIVSKDRCGTAQLPDLDIIKELSPHLLLSESALTDEDVSALEAMNVTVVTLARAGSVEELKQNYVTLARLMEGEHMGGAIGEKFAENLQARLDLLSGYLAAYTQEHGRKKVLYLRMLDYTVATGDTLENELLNIIGLDNIAAGYTDWTFPADEAKDGEGRKAFEAVEVIYCDEAIVSIKMLEQSAYYKSLQAVLKDWYLYIDSVVFERQSLRMLDQLELMAAYAYPDAVPSDGDTQSEETDEAQNEELP